MNYEMGEAVDYGSVRVASAGFRELWAEVRVDRVALVTYLKDAAAYNLPPNTRYELREKFPTHYGRAKGIAWYHHPEMADKPTWGVIGPTILPEGGFILVGQYVTPATKEFQTRT